MFYPFPSPPHSVNYCTVPYWLILLMMCCTYWHLYVCNLSLLYVPDLSSKRHDVAICKVYNIFHFTYNLVGIYTRLCKVLKLWKPILAVFTVEVTQCFKLILWLQTDRPVRAHSAATNNSSNSLRRILKQNINHRKQDFSLKIVNLLTSSCLGHEKIVTYLTVELVAFVFSEDRNI